MVKRRSTCSTSANQSPTSRHGVISDLLVGDCGTYRTRGGVHLPGGLSPWLARWCGTRCQTTGETRQSAETLSASTKRRFCLQCTDIRSAHWRFYDDVLYKSTFYLLTYLLNYLLTYLLASAVTVQSSTSDFVPGAALW